MEEQEVVVTPKTKINKLSIIIAVVLTAVTSVFASFFFLKDYYMVEPTTYTKLTEIQELIDKYYYGEVDPEELEKSVLSGFVYGTGDKYAAYYDISDSEKRSDSLSGNESGIGIMVTVHPDTYNIYVTNVYDNAPARKAGIRVGDQISAIDGVAVTETGYYKAVDSIIREIGETVELTILRGEEELNLSVTYSEFVIQSVFYHLTEEGYGYVEISSFNSETVEQLKNAVNSLSEQGAKALIFDLRGNGGGTVYSVTEIIDFLCPEGTIMTAKYADGTVETIAVSDEDEIDLPMVVLTNEATASAAEIFTAAIIEFDKGISIGSKTYGKGVMQHTYSLSDGSTVVITVAEYFIRDGFFFDEEGISPAIPVELTDQQIIYSLLLSEKEDPVIQAAISYLNENV